jgi:hypothetical protein
MRFLKLLKVPIAFDSTEVQLRFSLYYFCCPTRNLLGTELASHETHCSLSYLSQCRTTASYHGRHVLVFAASRDHLSNQVGRRPNERASRIANVPLSGPFDVKSYISSCPSSKMKTALNRENSTSSCCADPSTLTQSKFLIRLHGHTYCPCN